MIVRRAICGTVFGLLAGVWTGSVSAQDLMLPPYSEVGFLRLIKMAQAGQLGADVTNANVGVFKTWARVELVRTVAPNQFFVLTSKNIVQTICRYFNIEAAEGATATDAARLGKILDVIFTDDPFQLAPDFFRASPDSVIPTVADAWAYGGPRAVVRVLERRIVALAGIRYTVGVIVAVAVAVLASIVLLWGSTASHPPVQPFTDSR